MCYLVTALKDLTDEVRMPPSLFANHKESCACAGRLKGGEHISCVLRVRPVVEGQRYLGTISPAAADYGPVELPRRVEGGKEQEQQ